jgi:DNA-binding response OmpR family regulator
MRSLVFEVSQQLRGLEQMLGRTLGDHIQISWRVPSEMLCCTGDPGKLDQVIINLAVNARDAMPNGGMLNIECVRETVPEDEARPELTPGDYVCVSVADTGIGMDEETIKRAFEPFFTTKPQGQGTGLGLATCYGIVRQMGGGIAISSVKGEGTCFRVYLPASDELPSRDVAAPILSENDTLTGTILVVEDETSIREMMVRSLNTRGYEVLAAKDGKEGLALFEANKGTIDLLVTDVLLPRLTGYQLAARVLEQRPGLPILLTSGYTGAAMLDHQNVPELPVFWKPYSGARFVRRVREELLRHRARSHSLTPEPSPVESKVASRHQVLIVEDNPSVQKALTRTLQREGYTTTLVDKIADARSALQSESFAVILCDFNLPDGSAADLLEWVQAEHRAAADCMVILTGGAVDAKSAQWLDKHADRILLKPLHPKALLQKVRSLVEDAAP